MEMFNDVENVWPELPDEPPSPAPTSPPPQSPRILDREPTPWETLQALEDERLSDNSAVIRQLIYEPLYTHLTNVYIDWELEGCVCRVVGSSCYGRLYKRPGILRRHLESAYHVAHNASQVPRELTPPPRTDYIRQSIETSAPEDDNVTKPDATPNEIDPLPELVGSRSKSAEIADSQDTWSEYAVIVRASMEVADSQDPWSDLLAFDNLPSEVADSWACVTDVVSMEDLASEIGDSQPSIRPVLECYPTVQGSEADGESSDESESVKSVIFVNPCQEPNCEKCALNFTVS